MIEEAYCSYEVAKLLKEKGFDEPCIRHWDCDDHSLYGANDIPISNLELQANEYNGFSAPTHQMAVRWLREIHKIIISVYPFDRDATSEEITSYTCDIATTKYSSKYGHLRGIWRTYEEVVEVALKDCLKNIIK